jgi:hypothetical protein
VAPDQWKNLPGRLTTCGLISDVSVAEGPTWRPQDFRRFQVGRLADGREEWLEFWRANHLLAPFTELFARREDGAYGGRTLSFLGLPDLIRSKETERTHDWQDVLILEEFLDARNIARWETGATPLKDVLTQLRSRRGFERLLKQSGLADVAIIQSALSESRHPVTQAYLLPFVRSAANLPSTTVPIEPVILARLRKEPPASPLHLILVEAVRRHYRTVLQGRDRADKGAIRAGQVMTQPSPVDE